MTLYNRCLLVAVSILYLSLASFRVVLARSIPTPSVTTNLEQEKWKNSYKPMTMKCGFDIIKPRFHSENKPVHTVSHFELSGNRWPVGTTQLKYIYYSNPLFNGTFKNAVSNAFNTWKNVVKINFVESFSNANIGIAFQTGGIFYQYPQYDAYAYYPPSGLLLFNTKVTWVSSGDITHRSEPRRAEVESMALHEIGHLLGLAHSKNRSAVMYPIVTNGHVDLSEDDIDAVKAAYNIKP